MKRVVLFAAAAALAVAPAFAAAVGGPGSTTIGPVVNFDPCLQPSAWVPPPGCTYISPSQAHTIYGFNNLQFTAEHSGFSGASQYIGPTHVTETAHSVLTLHLVGKGELEGYNRTITLPVDFEVHSDLRDTKADRQAFKTDMFRVEGRADKIGDFAKLEIVGGTANGYPSPGNTTIIKQPDGQYLIQSTFDVHFSIAFEGAAGGPLAGLGGQFEGEATMTAVADKK